MSNVLLSMAGFIARALPSRMVKGLYRLGPVSHLIRRVLNRAAPTGLTEVTVQAGVLVGTHLALDLQKEKDYWLGTYEHQLQEAILELVVPGAIAYDIGANIGYITLIMARRVGESGKVFAFEALPANLERLKNNLGRNQLATRVQVVGAAIADKSAPIQFLVHSSTGMGKAAGAAGRSTTYESEITVSGISLDEFVYGQGNPSPDVIKIDIEGGEVLALPGMKRVLSEGHPLIFLELHGEEAARSCWDTLKQHGYQIHRMEPPFSPVDSVEELDWKAYLIAQPSP